MQILAPRAEEQASSLQEPALNQKQNEVVFKVDGAPATVRSKVSAILSQHGRVEEWGDGLRVGDVQFFVEEEGHTQVRVAAPLRLGVERITQSSAQQWAGRLSRQLVRRGVPAQAERALSWKAFILVVVAAAACTVGIMAFLIG